MDFALAATSDSGEEEARRYSQDFQAHLRSVSEAVTRSPRTRKAAKDQTTGLKKGSRSGSVASLVSLAVPSLAAATPEPPRVQRSPYCQLECHFISAF